jgi:hypothetical protein
LDTFLMTLPEIVQSALDDEAVAARVSLGGEDELLVTPTRTLVYRAEGLLSDESVAEYSHDAERVSVSEGRRKSKVTLDYGLDGEETFALPTKALDEALHPVLAGVFNAAGITEAGETVKRTFRFSELTVVVTSARLLKHIGPAVWDEDFEEFHYDDVTDLAFEDGNVATSVVLTVKGRQERFKAPNEQERALREALVDAVCAHHDAATLADFRAMQETDDEPDEPRDNVSFGDGPDPLSTNPEELSSTPDNATQSAEADDSGSFEFGTGSTSAVEAEAASEGDDRGNDDASEAGAGTDADVAAELAELRATIAEQNERLARQEELVEQLIEELRQGR